MEQCYAFFGNEKSEVEQQKSEIGGLHIIVEKLTMDKLLEECNKHKYRADVVESIKKVYSEINANQVFGASDVVKILDCADSTASEVVKRLRNMKVLVPVSGQGKGKYRFINKSDIEEI